MIRKLISLTAMVMLFSSVANSQTVTIEDTPNPGDTTTVTTVTTGNSVTTDNLISQKWNDGSWQGTMFPDSSDINESVYLTGKDGKYAETTIQSQDILTEQELQQGLTSELSADIRWWNPQESTVTMTQTATNGIDTTTQSITLEDTTNHNYQFNNYSNTLTITPNTENSHGSLTARFSFDIQGNANYNGGHSGVDVKDPELKLTYDVLSSTTVTTVQYCWEKTPPTCVGQDEIAEVETFLDTFESDIYLDDIYLYEQPGIIEDMDFDYSFNDNFYEEEEFEIQEDYLTLDEFFFEEDYFTDDYYEEFELEEFIPEDMAFEEVEFFDELPEITFEDEYFEEFNITELPPMEEMFFEEEMYFEEEIYMEAFTDEAFIEEFDEMFEEIPMEEMNVEMAEEMFEEMFEEYFEEEPPMEMVEEFKEEVIVENEEPLMEEPTEEIAMTNEEPIEETSNEQIEEQPSSESVITDEPQETTDVAEQEESLDEESAELTVVEGDSNKEPSSSGESISNESETNERVEVDLDIKVAALEKVIKNKISNEMQRVSITLDAVNEIVSKEMVASQPDISSYMDINQALFDTRQLPQGNPEFFNQVSLDSYSNEIYTNVAAINKMIGFDPIVQYQLKVKDAKDNTNKAYFKLKELMDARLN